MISRSTRSSLLLRLPLFALAAGLVASVLMASATIPARAQSQPQPTLHAQPPDDRSTPVAAVPEKREEVRDENDEYRHSPTVEKLGAMLGMNTEQAATAFTVFNFVVLLIGVGFVLVKTLPKTFRNRSTAIQKQLVDARTATEEANARLNSVETRLSKLDEQIAAMHQQAENDAVREEQRLKQSVEDESARILAAAEAEIHSATALARRQIQQYAAELAIEQAARKLVVTAETDRLLVENFAQRLGASVDKGGQN